MRFVIDTNIVLPSIFLLSPTHLVIQSLDTEKFRLCVTTDILLEYEEKIAEKISQATATNFMDALLSNPSLLRVEKFYFWRLISADPDDNKFVDCAVAANVDYLVSDDRHFKVLKNTPFPKVNLIGMDEFMEILARL